MGVASASVEGNVCKLETTVEDEEHPAGDEFGRLVDLEDGEGR